MKPDPNIDYSHPVCRMNVAINCKYGTLEICSACDTCGWNPEVSEKRIEEMYGDDSKPGLAYLDEDDEPYYMSHF